ncbi:odorant receptor 13a-like [Chelonus insularis]|uniref:odorant receptor 13a-like n=1 Tax=Chelonus insularis TaxID=460826 RepID=UPI00158F446E|nr:odorant receptor 13a-like [Chelonus insularis]
MYGTYAFSKIHYTNVMLLTKSFSVMTSLISMMIKMGCLLLNDRDVDDLYKELNSQFNIYVKDEHLKISALKGSITFYRLCMADVISTFVFCAGYCLVPVIFIIHQCIKNPETKKNILLYPAVYPWNVTPDSIVYVIQVVIESLSLISSFCVNAAVDSFYSFCVFQITGLIREVSYDVTNINKKKEYRIIIRQCVHKFEKIMSCRNKLERIYGPIILWIMVSNATILCTTIFQLTHIWQIKTLSFARLVVVIAYVSMKLTQTFLYGWAGTRLTTESENFREAVYSSNWIGNSEFSSAIRLMLVQKPLKLTAFKFFVVSVDMFAKIVNTTVSYYFLLKTFESD